MNVERFWAEVDKTGDCWLWKARKSFDGFGEVTVRNTRMNAHRVSWMMANGTIPSGMCVKHKCDVPACVNPDHLWLGKHGETMESHSNES